MDRISALRNVEDALRAFEEGEADLATTERQVVNVLRTYATDFEDEGDLSAYRASGDERAEGLVVVATSPEEAEARVRDLLDAGGELTVTVERIG
jgi:alkanesulfonate monooxygenase SsuD/methylene tetrahydromethanopterin reductase-like flavin-dependent oxidoreductase (luciferase family)